jgi:nitronate monooxygenase
MNKRDLLRDKLLGRLRLPLIAAPMLRVSGPELVIAARRAGVIGAFPTANISSTDELDVWLTRISNMGAAEQIEGSESDPARRAAPYCPNLIVRHSRLTEDLACLIRHRVELVITSVGSPSRVVAPLHDIGCLVLADVATLHHAEKAIAAGVDGLVLLTAGAGGQTGWMNPFSFVRSVRSMFDGLIVLAGGISDGVALRAATMLGCDLAYMGTKFIATKESMADGAYQQMLVESSLDDILLTRSFTGLPANMLRPSIVAAGLDPANLDENVTAAEASEKWGKRNTADGPKRWAEIWSAGHSVSGVTQVSTVQELVDQTAAEYGSV